MIRYKKEFKQSLVEMHNQGRSYTDISAEYGPSVDSIRNWIKLYAVHEVGGEKWTQADVNALQLFLIVSCVVQSRQFYRHNHLFKLQ
ncbi:helix-turn-helix domain-containing protein [Weissella paramesenteroides]|uniref:helix-turn-helix domain-containing protein n=1 Tax=Weissella paramesenteroides TaxID=1249 RepID=UPI003D9A7D6E